MPTNLLVTALVCSSVGRIGEVFAASLCFFLLHIFLTYHHVVGEVKREDVVAFQIATRRHLAGRAINGNAAVEGRSLSKKRL